MHVGGTRGNNQKRTNRHSQRVVYNRQLIHPNLSDYKYSKQTVREEENVYIAFVDYKNQPICLRVKDCRSE